MPVHLIKQVAYFRILNNVMFLLSYAAKVVRVNRMVRSFDSNLNH